MGGFRMYAHVGLRPLWPVIFFLPLVFVGVAYLLESLRHGRAWMASIHRLKPAARSVRHDRSS